jgi:hypothetical protein
MDVCVRGISGRLDAHSRAVAAKYCWFEDSLLVIPDGNTLTFKGDSKIQLSSGNAPHVPLPQLVHVREHPSPHGLVDINIHKRARSRITPGDQNQRSARPQRGRAVVPMYHGR